MTILDKPPHVLFEDMGTAEVEDMLGDIETNFKADVKHKSLWKALLYSCSEALDAKNRARGGGGSFGDGVSKEVVGDIQELLTAKTRPELEEMQTEIKGSLQQGGEGLDTQFFEAVLAKIPLFMANAEITEWHEKAVKKIDSLTGKPAAKAAVQAAPAEESASEEEDQWSDLPGSMPQAGGGVSPEPEPEVCGN